MFVSKLNRTHRTNEIISKTLTPLLIFPIKKVKFKNTNHYHPLEREDLGTVLSSS